MLNEAGSTSGLVLASAVPEEMVPAEEVGEAVELGVETPLSPVVSVVVGPVGGCAVSKAVPSKRRGRPIKAERAAMKAAGLMPSGWKHLPRGRPLPGVTELEPVNSYPDVWTGMKMGRKGALFIYHQIDGTSVVRRTTRRPMEIGVKTRVMMEVHFDVRTPIYIIGNQDGHQASEIIPDGCPLPGTDVRD